MVQLAITEAAYHWLHSISTGSGAYTPSREGIVSQRVTHSMNAASARRSSITCDIRLIRRPPAKAYSRRPIAVNEILAKFPVPGVISLTALLS